LFFDFRFLDIFRQKLGLLNFQTTDEMLIHSFLWVCMQPCFFSFFVKVRTKIDDVRVHSITQENWLELLQRKRHFEIEICDRLSVLRLFHVGHVRNRPKCRFTYLARIFVKPENERFTSSGSCWRQNFGEKKVSKCLKEMEIISAHMGGLPLTIARGSKPRNVDQPRNAAQWFTLKSFK